jgi:toxin ParE1/3/4
VRAVIGYARARRDLAEIWDHIAESGEQAAVRLVDRIEAEISKLREMPGMGHERRDVPASKKLRFWTVWPYVIAYRATRRTLYVMRVVHGSRNFRRVF